MHDNVEIYMDDFIVHGNIFQQALTNLKNILPHH